MLLSILIQKVGKGNNMIIGMVVIVCVLGILFNISIRFYKKAKVHTGSFCECKIYSKFADVEVSVDDVNFKLLQ